MSTAELLESFSIEDRGADGRVVVRARIGDAWAILFAQGGVVMAAMLKAAELGLGRPDLALASTSATFCRPVPCGPVTITVDVLRSGRRGAQVHAALRCDGDDDPSPNAVATVVCTAAAEDWPRRQGQSWPPGLRTPPDDATAPLGPGGEGEPRSGFFASTDWRPAAEQPEEVTRRLAWCALTDPAERADGTWEPAMLAVPGDALGLAAVPTVADVGPVVCPSLQISMQVHGPARGRWIGIDSRCDETHDGIASGVATLWDASGALVATVAQTALFRRVDPG